MQDFNRVTDDPTQLAADGDARREHESRYGSAGEAAGQARRQTAHRRVPDPQAQTETR
jgi:hypothetical protein